MKNLNHPPDTSPSKFFDLNTNIGITNDWRRAARRKLHSWGKLRFSGGNKQLEREEMKLKFVLSTAKQALACLLALQIQKDN